MDIKKTTDKSCKRGYTYHFRITDNNNKIKVIKSCVDKKKLNLYAFNWCKDNIDKDYIWKTII